MATVSKVIGTDQIKKRTNLMGSPSFAAIPATITFAEAAISVPFPPKQDPSDSAHQTGIIASLPPNDSSIDLSMGIIVATNGILSIADDRKAEIQIINIVVFSMLLSVIAVNFCPAKCKTPVSYNPCTIINSPAKKKIVVQSTI